MALKDQPYLPLYIQDIMTDEKLNECSAATHGIYIKGIMCLMHKSENYGKLLLKQKFKQSYKQIPKHVLEHLLERLPDVLLSDLHKTCLDFAVMLERHLPYKIEEIFTALVELLTENVCQLEGDFLVQKRMVKDYEISVKRSKSGKIGGFLNKKNLIFKQHSNNKKNKDDFASTFASGFAYAKVEANTEYENNYIIEDKNNSTVKEKLEVLNFENNKEVKNFEEKKIEPLGGELVKKIANDVFKDTIWKEQISMANFLKPNELKIWMAQFNASIMNDVIENFNTNSYKKMFGGWLKTQQAKNYKLPINQNHQEQLKKL